MFRNWVILQSFLEKQVVNWSQLELKLQIFCSIDWKEVLMNADERFHSNHIDISDIKDYGCYYSGLQVCS